MKNTSKTNDWIVGDVVRLTTAALKKFPVKLDKRTFPTARITDTIPEILGGGFVVDRHLNGSLFWEARYLVRAKKSKVTLAQQLPIKLYRGFMPSNFSADQMTALRAFEAAVSINQQPARSSKERRSWRKVVVESFNNVKDAGVLSALTPNELQHVDHANSLL